MHDYNFDDSDKDRIFKTEQTRGIGSTEELFRKCGEPTQSCGPLTLGHDIISGYWGSE